MLLMSNILSTVASILSSLLSLYFWIVVAAALITWVRPDPNNVIVRILYRLTEPLFYRVRKWLPFTYMSGIDFSPVVVLIAIEIVNRGIVKSIAQYAAAM